FSSRRRHTRFSRDWSSDVCSSDLFVTKRKFKMKPLTRFLTTAVLAAALPFASAFADAAPKTQTSASTITTRDGVEIYYKDWGPKDGQVVVFSHGWPLNSDSWESQMQFLADKGYRAIAHDRRGHGRSSQPWDGNDMDHYADDLADVLKTLKLKDVTLVGFSTGGGEVARYIGRHGSDRIKKADRKSTRLNSSHV